jgi:hypothetical protein
MERVHANPRAFVGPGMAGRVECLIPAISESYSPHQSIH